MPRHAYIAVAVLRRVLALLEQLSAHRFDECLWHESLLLTLEGSADWQAVLTWRGQAGAPRGSLSQWLSDLPEPERARLVGQKQADLGEFTIPGGQRELWLRWPQWVVEHVPTPTGALLGVLYCLPRSGVARFTLLRRHGRGPRWRGAEPMLLRLLVRQLARRYRRRELDPLDDALQRLAPRHMQTLGHLLRGGSEQAIAQLMGCSPHTVHTYVKGLYDQLRVSSRGELMALFIDPRLPCASITTSHRALPEHGHKAKAKVKPRHRSRRGKGGARRPSR